MKKVLLWLVATCCVFHAGSAEEWSSTDYNQFLETLKQYKIKASLEFGTGTCTDYLLQNSNKVISVDFITPGYGPENIQRYLPVYSYASNWMPIVFFSAYVGNTDWAPYKYLGSEHVHKAASYQCATHQNYALEDDFYLVELDAFISRLVKHNRFQVSFVNSGLYIRGDLVQLLFGKVPVIFASDTSCRANGVQNDVYGYSRVVTPDDYIEIYLSDNSGITIWIQQGGKFQSLIDQLIN